MRKFLVIVALVLLAPAAPSWANPADEGEHRAIHFPVEGAVSFSDDFGDPRVGHTHEGTDLMGKKGQPLLAAVDGTVTSVRPETGGTAGNMLTIKDADGFAYRYMHINNDTPGTDDNLNPLDAAFAAGMVAGAKVKAGQVVAFMGDSGNAESTAPHLHFEIRRPDGTPMNPWTSLRLARGLPAGTRCAVNSNPRSRPSSASAAGYYVLGADGGIYSFGDAPFLGSVPGLGLPARVQTIRLAVTKSGRGYWILGADGGIFTFGDAEFLGSVPGTGARNVKAVDLRPTATGKGYWVLGQDGAVFSFGDAAHFGSVPEAGVSTKALRLVPTPTGQGYWILGHDGGVFSFGDASFAGSVPGVGVATRVVSLGAGSKSGYWVLGEDGGVFSFGVPFLGSVPGAGLCTWPTGIQLVASSTGKGYWVLGGDGTVWPFGDAADHGGVKELGLKLAAPVIDLAVVHQTR